MRGDVFALPASTGSANGPGLSPGRLVEDEDRTAGYAALFEIVDGLVDLVDSISLGDQSIEIEVAIRVPIKEAGEILRRCATATEAGDECSLADEHVHAVQLDGRLWHANQHGSSAFGLAKLAAPGCFGDLGHRDSCADAVEGVVHASNRLAHDVEFDVALGESSDLFDCVAG